MEFVLFLSILRKVLRTFNSKEKLSKTITRLNPPTEEINKNKDNKKCILLYHLRFERTNYVFMSLVYRVIAWLQE
jgi:hypothetical protein